MVLLVAAQTLGFASYVPYDKPRSRHSHAQSIPEGDDLVDPPRRDATAASMGRDTEEYHQAEITAGRPDAEHLLYSHRQTLRTRSAQCPLSV